MSSIEQYEVYDCLSLSKHGDERQLSIDAGDPYHDMVTVFGNHIVNSFVLTDYFIGLFTQVNNGYSIAPVSAVDPGSKDFCIEMVFRLPKTYSSELFDELREIDQPIFYTGGFSDTRSTDRISLYIYNNHKTINVGLNGLYFVCRDSDGNIASVACPAELFLWWLNTETQYKSITVGRRGQTFFMYVNGKFAAESTPTTFGAINIPEADTCHVMVVPEHYCLTNFLSCVRVTIGASRASGNLHIHKVNADAPLFSSAPKITRKKSLGLLPSALFGGVVPARKRCEASTMFDSGYLFPFDSIGAASVYSDNNVPSLCRSIIGNKTLYPFGSGYINTIDKGLRCKNEGGMQVTGQNFTDFIFGVSFSVDEETATDQLVLQITTNGTTSENRRRLYVKYSNGFITFEIKTIDFYSAATATNHTSTVSVPVGEKSVVIGRSAAGFFCISGGVVSPVSYGSFDTINTMLLGYGCPSCEIHEFYYRDSGVTQSVLVGYASFFADRNMSDIDVVATGDSGACKLDETTSGNVLTNDTGRYLRVTKVNGSTGNVGVAVAGSDGGLFTIGEDGSWTFDPDGDFITLEGSETADTSVTYHASDGVSEASATLTITVIAGGVETDPMWEDVALLIQAPESGTTIADATGKTVTTQGNVAISTALGYPTIYFDGNGDRLDVGAVSDFNFLHNGSGWTAEFVLAPSSIVTDDTIIDTTRGSTSNQGVFIAYSGGKIRVMITRGVSSSYVIDAVLNHTFSPGAEKTVCLEYDHSLTTGTLKMYVDGALVASANKTANAPSTANHQAMMVGMFHASYPGFSYHGHARYMRLTEGVRYGDEHTPPTWPLPTS